MAKKKNVVTFDQGPREWSPRWKTVTVIFRTWPDGDVVALFPELAGDVSGWLCDSYMHVGQHGSANATMVIEATRPSTPEEYKPLLEELGRVGYEKLKIVKRQTPDMIRRRLARGR